MLKKKLVVAIVVILASATIAYTGINKISQSGGLRGGDVFQENTIDAIRMSSGEEPNYTNLSDIIHCNEKICIQIFRDDDNNEIKIEAFEKRNNKFAYIYGLGFTLNEITEKNGLIPYDVFSKSEVVYGIMPADKSGVIINGSVEATVTQITANEKDFKCWYAIVDGGIDSIDSIEYA